MNARASRASLMPRTSLAFVTLGALAALVSCANETSGALVTFHAYASGPSGTHGAIDFATGAGFRVHLTKATLHIGAVYFRLGQTNPGSANASCFGDTTYGLQVTGSVDVETVLVLYDNPAYIGFSMAIGPRGKTLAERFSTALRKMKQDGTYARLEHRYFG